MNYFQSEIHGKVYKPSNFAELIELVTAESPISRNVRYWRGQSDITWRIDSSAYRRLLNTDLLKLDLRKILIDYEKALLEQATHKGYRYYEGRELSDFELLGRLQHHGAATRLVDFSKNVLIALWFSIIENTNKDGLLIGISTDYIIGGENMLINENYNEVIKKCEKSNSLYTYEPPNISRRMAAQHSQFLYSAVSESKAGSLILPTENDSVLLISIDSSLKQKFKDILERAFNFLTMTLFPDIDGFGKANNQLISRWDMDRW